MPSVNKVILCGNVGNPPKTGTTKNGHNWCNLSIATQKKVKDVYQTTWHRIVAWGKTAEYLGTCVKGDVVFVEGELQVNQWDDKDGKKQTQVQVLANQAMKGARKSAGEELGFSDEPGYESGFDGDQGF